MKGKKYNDDKLYEGKEYIYIWDDWWNKNEKRGERRNEG